MSPAEGNVAMHFPENIHRGLIGLTMTDRLVIIKHRKATFEAIRRKG